MFSSNLQRVFLLLILGILLMFLGSGLGNDGEWLGLAGALVFTVSLVWGGLFLVGESLALRIALLAIGGLGAINLFSSGGGSPF